MAMKIKNRSGELEDVKFDKVTARIEGLANDLTGVSSTMLAQKVLANIRDGINTSEIDEITADISATQTSHVDYSTLAGRILVSNLQKNTPSFPDAMKILHADGIIPAYNPAILQKVVIYPERDNLIDFFGLKTLIKMYLTRNRKGEIMETPQYMFMRVAIAICKGDHVAAQETYDAMSQKYYIHATPTLFNAGTNAQQLSSCFLVAMKEDSIDGIYDTKKDCARISKMAGGIGLHIHNIRSKGSKIKGNNGTSDGIIPMLRTLNADARYVNQGGRRKGSYAIYLSPDHPDIMDFLDIRLNQGDEEARCRDLFPALWVPDLFMKCVENDSPWALFDPSEAPGLCDVYGEEYENLYNKYLSEGLARKILPASTVWKAIIKSQIETGTPYMLYKDACNHKTNQKNLGTIKSSNLCTEIIEHSDAENTAVCNLASIGLPSFIVNDKHFDYKHLEKITRLAVRNLNKVIDISMYPVDSAKNSNLSNRPIGIGVQGLADVYAILDIEFGETDLNKLIFETIYYAAVSESVEIAKLVGPYDNFKGSPASQGLFQFDLWGVTPTDRYNWEYLRADMVKYGLRNSLLIAPMPTASTSQILGFNECFEPFTTNLYLRRTLAGEFVVVNKYLVNDLTSLSLWNKEIRQMIIRNNGSVQGIDVIPEVIKRKYKTVWEISQRKVIDLAAERGPYICQSQSMNLFMADPSIAKISSMHLYAWKSGLKTGMYYLRTRPKANPIQFTVEPPPCTMCSS